MSLVWMCFKEENRGLNYDWVRASLKLSCCRQFLSIPRSSINIDTRNGKALTSNIHLQNVLHKQVYDYNCT